MEAPWLKPAALIVSVLLLCLGCAFGFTGLNVKVRDFSLVPPETWSVSCYLKSCKLEAEQHGEWQPGWVAFHRALKIRTKIRQGS